MTRAGAAALAAAIAAAGAAGAPAVARAGSCGGGSDGGGGGSSGGSSSSSSDSGGGGGGSYDGDSSSSSGAPVGCIETSDVLGRRSCGGFGAWAMPAIAPYLAIEVGTSARRFSLGRLALAGTIDHGDEGRYAYRVVESGRDDAIAAVGADLRLLAGRRLYGGAELQLAGVSEGERSMALAGPAVDTPGASLDARLQLAIATGGVVGARGRLGDVTLAGEVFGGVRVVQVELTSRLGACETVEYEQHARGVLEARARLDWWASPWITLGAYLGTDVLDPGSRAIGVTLGGHLRAFDGVP